MSVQRFALGRTVRASSSGEDESFRTHPGRPQGPLGLLQWALDLFPGVKQPGRDAEHPSPSTAEVEYR